MENNNNNLKINNIKINKSNIINYHLKTYKNFYDHYNVFEKIEHKNMSTNDKFNIMKKYWNKYHIEFLDLGDGHIDFEFNPNLGYALSINDKYFGYCDHFIDKNGFEYKLDSNYIKDMYNQSLCDNNTYDSEYESYIDSP